MREAGRGGRGGSPCGQDLTCVSAQYDPPYQRVVTRFPQVLAVPFEAIAGLAAAFLRVAVS